MKTFAELGLPDALVHTLAKRDITEPFPVQEATIPDALAGRDVSGKAPTGSGKTLAFGLPLLTRVDQAVAFRPRALVLAPTRELAEQIKKELAPLAKASRRFVLAVYGGVGYGPQKNALRKGVDVLVATPGRLEDLMQQKSVDLRDVDIVVVDEADRMADMGFLPAVRRILDRTSSDRQTLLFSATLDGDIAVLSRDYQRDPVRHEAGTVDPETIDARHHFWLVQRHDRVAHTAEIVEKTGNSIVFTRTRHGADRLARQLGKHGIGAVAMHGGRNQNQRNRALKEFASGRAQALIATDVAARGIHIDAVAAVVHFDPPADHKDYLHRSGRTARAGATGTVVSLVAGDQRRGVQRMQQDLRLHAPIEKPRLDDLQHGGHRMGEPGRTRPGRKEAPGRSRERRVEKTSESPRRDDRRTERHRGDEPRRERRDRSNGATGARQSLYVSNLPWEATAEDMHELFGRYGKVHDATIITNQRTGRSRGFGFVEMARPAADTAMGELHGSSLKGRDLQIKLARPRTPRPRRRS
ncbi:MAG: DEAD/DEAH box helicase [Acidimicrobiia bacterium]|nr:DEAD/DEAH box helicase [Acidimicrobiia bacterium]